MSAYDLPPKVHILKIDPEPFAAVATGVKRAELRKDDRGFRVRDELHLREWENNNVTGRVVKARITHIQRGYGLRPEIVMLSIEVFFVSNNH